MKRAFLSVLLGLAAGIAAIFVALLGLAGAAAAVLVVAFLLAASPLLAVVIAAVCFFVPSVWTDALKPAKKEGGAAENPIKP